MVIKPQTIRKTAFFLMAAMLAVFITMLLPQLLYPAPLLAYDDEPESYMPLPALLASTAINSTLTARLMVQSLLSATQIRLQSDKSGVKEWQKSSLASYVAVVRPKSMGLTAAQLESWWQLSKHRMLAGDMTDAERAMYVSRNKAPIFILGTMKGAW